MQKIISLFFIAAVFISSCKKDIASGTPKCIKSKINADNNLIIVDEYFFQNKTVYTFSTDIPDYFTDVYDGSCKLICQLGGFAGIKNCNTENFYQVAVFKRTIWKK